MLTDMYRIGQIYIISKQGVIFLCIKNVIIDNIFTSKKADKLYNKQIRYC